MGDWIKENKFEAALLFVVLLIGGVIYYFAGKWGSAYDEALGEHQAQVSLAKRFSNMQPYPTPKGAEEYEKVVGDYRTVVEDLQKSLVAYRPETFEQITPADFTDRLNAAVTSLTQRYASARIEFPEDKWKAGFGAYTVTPPPEDATAYLAYQLAAMQWVFERLADVGPSALLNVYREQLPVEKGEEMDPAPAKRPGSRSSSKSVSDGKAYYSLPVELTFRAHEAAVREFLSGLAGADEYYFVVRSVRITNEKGNKLPKKDGVEFDEDPVDDPDGGGDAFDPIFEPVDPGDEEAPPEEGPAEGEAPAEAPPADDGRRPGRKVLGQILGAEELNVFVKLELILFKDDVKLP